MQKTLKSLLTLGTLACAVGFPTDAEACGGFFCSQAQPVNQAAERIVFAHNGDGTVTAIIQILYEGPSESFSWLLPISSVPMGDEIAIASNLAFQRLQSATNPQYSLTLRVEGTCRPNQAATGGGFATGGTASGGSAGTGGSSPGADGGITVVGTGIVGEFEWTVISVDQALPEPADAAVTWLGDNGYDVPPGSPALLGPYLADGMYLLALRLTKGADVGSIRPIVLTYAASQPMIPIKLTAVAANEDMGVMTWLLADSRGVPQNYNALELNEARINWFNPAPTYESVVTAAADDAGGQGFVTEYAGPTSALANVVWSTSDTAQWQSFSTRVYSSFDEIFNSAYGQYGTYDGFWDAIRATVTLPADVMFADFQACPSCYSSQIQFSPAALIAQLETDVIEPIRLVQTVIDAHPAVTRLYSTLSAMEMTTDPLFTFNPDLPDVSNIHLAERVIECNPNIYQSEAPWRIELPQGGVVRGTANQVGTWPAEFSEQPANFRILRQSDSGEGRVVEDNAEAIETMLNAYNNTIPGGASGRGGASGTGGSSGSSGLGGASGTSGSNGSNDSDSNSNSGGCSIAGSAHSAIPWAALGLGLLVRRFRRKRNTA